MSSITLNMDMKFMKKPINRLFYMDDLKLYAKNDKESEGLLSTVKQFSDDIGMEFGLDKCAKATFIKGKLTRTTAAELDIDTANRIEAINTLAMPVVQHSFNVINWILQ